MIEVKKRFLPVDYHVGIGRRVEPVDEVVRGVVGVWAWPAAGMPDGGALQEHLLAVAEGLATLGAAGARRVEVVVVTGLKHDTHLYKNLVLSSSITNPVVPEGLCQR